MSAPAAPPHVCRPTACGRPNGYPARECTREYGHEGDHWHSEMHLAGVAIHKRHGVGSLGDQYVTMRLDDLVALLTGERRET